MSKNILFDFTKSAPKNAQKNDWWLRLQTMVKRLTHLAKESGQLPEQPILVSFCSPKKIRAMNWSFRKVDKETDILSFSAGDSFVSCQNSLADLVNEPSSALQPAFVLAQLQNKPLLQSNPQTISKIFGKQNDEIYLCWQKVQQQATEYGWPVEIETLRLLIHGWAHLVGYDHELSEQAEQIMLAWEKKWLKALGLQDVYGD